MSSLENKAVQTVYKTDFETWVGLRVRKKKLQCHIVIQRHFTQMILFSLSYQTQNDDMKRTFFIVWKIWVSESVQVLLKWRQLPQSKIRFSLECWKNFNALWTWSFKNKVFAYKIHNNKTFLAQKWKCEPQRENYLDNLGEQSNFFFSEEKN